ncbi:MAG TPA: hypothetical protein ENI48_02615 [Thioploca sp.]|nr:hypothetical protein [Thioploca sp.]
MPPNWLNVLFVDGHTSHLKNVEPAHFHPSRLD